MRQFLRNLIVCLGALGFLIQAIVGSGGAGRALCVGCDQTWWTVSSPCDPAGGVDCCSGDEAAQDTHVHPSQPLAHNENDCGCIDVPLPDHAVSAVAVERADLSGHFVTLAYALPMWSCVPTDGPTPTEAWARAGPKSPPRLLLPQSRFTVLVI